MAEYIDRGDLTIWLNKKSCEFSMNDVAPIGWTLKGLVNELSTFPSANVVERKVGKWLFWQDDPDANVYECSACHEPLTLNEGTPRENNFNFCPFCGLPMKEGDDDV